MIDRIIKFIEQYPAMSTAALTTFIFLPGLLVLPFYGLLVAALTVYCAFIAVVLTFALGALYKFVLVDFISSIREEYARWKSDV